MNEYELESVRLRLGAALIHLSRARGRHFRDDDLARAADALERANEMLTRHANRDGDVYD